MDLMLMLGKQKNELLFKKGINFNDLPNWQKQGVGVYWEKYEKNGYNPVTCENVFAIRNRLKVDLELPMKDKYSEFIEILIRKSENNSEQSHSQGRS
jgi:tRNA(His) guanylyltransferase